MTLFDYSRQQEAMTCAQAGKLGATIRHQRERERVLEVARKLAARHDPRLYPELILTRRDMA